MEACGVCHSDLFVAGLEKLPLAPLTLGHEGIARVEAVGAGVSGWSPGDRAGITFLGTTCGSCEWCSSGRERFCPRQTNFGYTLHGALTEYAIVPAAALVRVPEALAAAEAAPLCCAGWTAFGALREAGLKRGDSVALFGLGGLGHLALQMAQGAGTAHRGRGCIGRQAAHGARVGRGSGGPRRRTPAAPCRKSTAEWMRRIVLTPSASAIHQAFRALKRTGTLVLVGLAMSQYELPLVDTVLKGITVRGSYLGTPQDLAEVFALAAAGAHPAHVHTARARRNAGGAGTAAARRVDGPGRDRLVITSSAWPMSILRIRNS